MVDYKSGDIVVDGKIISLTKESVHCVLGIPLGGDPFPSDTVCGKEFVLNKFQKSSIPPVTFFSNKLVKEGGTLSDEDLFVCFIIVALSSFLCANSSSTACPKYFGIFGDIKRVKEFDWCGYVLDWLLDGVKLFKKSKPSKVKDNRTLAGCLYYLAVMYLDFVDFGPRRLPNTLPRICVWKGNMLKTYSDLDLKPNGSYGFRPVLDFSDTAKLPKKCEAPISSRNVTFSTAKVLDLSDSPDVEVVGQTSFSQSALQMARQSDLIYNKRFRMSNAPSSPPPKQATTTFCDLGSGSSLSMLPTYHQRDSSTGGKMPVHGPRRLVKPGFLFNEDFETAKPKITVSKSEIKNYQGICNLATSGYSNEDAVSIGKVRCTFWSLG